MLPQCWRGRRLATGGTHRGRCASGPGIYLSVELLDPVLHRCAGAISLRVHGDRDGGVGESEFEPARVEAVLDVSGHATAPSGHGLPPS